ncbi:MAG TPA: radical SAM protein [Ktedonobacteraceae bacterium]|jgi:radical SAM protein with 4Fe4S-binding SPASM domain|nr:radical SAM protein [Ktedonobacteraceae bacterium]
MQLPAYVQIEPVGQCNLRCQMCSIQFRQDGPPYGPPAFMDFEAFTRMIDQFVNVRELHLQGLGEPMMHPRFFDMVTYAVAKGIRVSTNSNLTLLNGRRAELCVTSGLNCLHVSLDGATPETYERIRARAHYDRVTANLERLLVARKRLGSDHPRIHLVMVIMQQNLHELPQIVRLAHGWSVEEMFVQHLCHDFGETSLPSHYRPMREFVQAQTLLEEDPERVAYYFGEARAVAQELGVKLRLPRTQPRQYAPGTPGRVRCSWPWQGAYISYQGYAMPCCMVSTPDRINFGNMAEQGVEKTWNSPDFQAFRDQLASDEPPEICRSCALYLGTF